MGRRRRIGGLAVALLTVVYGAVSWFFSQRLVAGQFPTTPEAEFADFGLPKPEEVAFCNGKTRLAGWCFANPSRAGCAVVMLHGFTGNRAGVLEAAPIFWLRGCDLFVYDLRGHGESSGGLLTYGVHDKGDELAAVDWLRRRTGLSERQIGMIGWSYGAATSLLAASARPGLAFVIADSSYSSLADIAAVQAEARYGRLARLFVPGALLVSAVRARFNPLAASPERAIRGLTTPVLLIHATTDEFTPVRHAEAIYAASNPSRTELALTEWGAEHAQSYTTDSAAYDRIVGRFLAAHAPHFGVRPG